MDKILITTSAFGKDDPAALGRLRDAGYEVMLNPYQRKLTEDEVLSLILKEKPVGMIAGVEPLTADVLGQAGELKVISRCGVGMDSVDLAAAENRGIAVVNTPDGPTRAVAELTVGLMLGMLRRILFLDREIRRGSWVKESGNLLGGKVVGIIGAGRIGRKVIELIKPFGVEVMATDPRPDMTWLEANEVSLANLDNLLSEADIISLHLAYNQEGQHLISEREFAMMKQGAFLLNLSRGEVIDEAALVAALAGGKLAGAALDVFSHEPYSGPLTGMDNVILTPHVGSYAREARINMEMQAVENLLGVLGQSV